jgi:hypothetical protein
MQIQDLVEDCYKRFEMLWSEKRLTAVELFFRPFLSKENSRYISILDLSRISALVALGSVLFLLFSASQAKTSNCKYTILNFDS